jgi:hypothetical protein
MTAAVTILPHAVIGAVNDDLAWHPAASQRPD